MHVGLGLGRRPVGHANHMNSHNAMVNEGTIDSVAPTWMKAQWINEPKRTCGYVFMPCSHYQEGGIMLGLGGGFPVGCRWVSDRVR